MLRGMTPVSLLRQADPAYISFPAPSGMLSSGRSRASGKTIKKATLDRLVKLR